jgi:hypothetical protein
MNARTGAGLNGKASISRVSQLPRIDKVGEIAGNGIPRAIVPVDERKILRKVESKTIVCRGHCQ